MAGVSSVVFAVPYVPPAPKPRPFNSYRHTWTGSDGSVWNLSDPSTGVFLLRDGVTGLHLPPVERHVSESPGTYGSRFRGSRTQARPVEWLVHLFSDVSSAAWMELDAAFWRSFSTDTAGTWTVSAPNGQKRELLCRLDSEGGFQFGHDPARKGWVTYPINLIADDPFWRGAPVVREWLGTPDMAEFFDAAGSPPFFISNSSSAAEATIDNPGDVEAWPVWTVYGPSTDLTLTVNGGTIGVPNVGAGQSLVVDTNPRVATAIRNGTTDLSAQVDPWDPRPIPAGKAVPLTISATTLEKVKVEITPLYRRGL